MKYRLFIAFMLLLGVCAQAQTWTAGDVEAIIEKVNDTWQATHPQHERAFWDNAVYHTGNMAAYALLQKRAWADYSEAWAKHNLWQGARETNPAKWKYKNYGEGQDYVLFGDWQICFQTYIDLYNLQPEPNKIARAKEVMDYEAASDVDDYWWWQMRSTW